MSCECHFPPSFLEKVTELIAKSEDRIDRTNAMIDRLSTITAHLTEVYDEHLKELEKSRNEIVSQNTRLMELVLAEQKKSNDILMIQERLITAFVGRNSSSSTINIRDIASNNQ